MTIYDLKPAFQNLLRPVCKAMAKAGVTANQVTLLALALSLITGAVVFMFDAARWALGLIPIILFIRMALNAIDGMLAREHNMKTSLGAVLNEIGDVVSDTALYLPLAAIPGMPAHILVVAVAAAIMSEMMGVVAVQIGTERRYDGPMGKSDRAFAFGLLALLVACGVPSGRWITVYVSAILVLLVLTIFRRARGALKAVQS